MSVRECDDRGVPPRPTIEDVIAATEVLSLSNERVFARGLDYYIEGRVDISTHDRAAVHATVRGTMPYVVALELAGTGLTWSCTCPAAEDGSFCKHCVAVALSVVPPEPPPAKKKGARRAPFAPEPDFDAFVRSLTADELVKIVLEQAEVDWRLHERLATRAAVAAGAGVDERAWRERLKRAFATRERFIDYAEAPEWAAGVHDVLDALAELVDSGHAAAVIGLAEYAHELTEKMMVRIDDSDGWIIRIEAELGELHLRACELAAADPVGLAGRLVGLELSAELGIWHRAADRYAHVLGADGLAEYRRHIEPRWRKAVAEADAWSSERFRLQHAMTAIVLAAGDPDEIVRVKQHAMQAPDDYREVVEVLWAAGRVNEAVTWARKGLDAFVDRPWQTPPLREVLATVLREAGRHDEAVAEFWEAFAATPSLDAYRRLLREAGDGAREHWRGRCLGVLESRVGESPSDGVRRALGVTSPPAVLVEVLLFEGDVEAAWQAAGEHGAPDRLWLDLARARAKEHPLEVIPVYERAAAREIDRKDNAGYRRAVEHLGRVRTLAAAARSPDVFDHVLSQVRTVHKAKRNLMAMLDANGW